MFLGRLVSASGEYVYERSDPACTVHVRVVVAAAKTRQGKIHGFLTCADYRGRGLLTQFDVPPPALHRVTPRRRNGKDGGAAHWEHQEKFCVARVCTCAGERILFADKQLGQISPRKGHKRGGDRQRGRPCLACSQSARAGRGFIPGSSTAPIVSVTIRRPASDGAGPERRVSAGRKTRYPSSTQHHHDHHLRHPIHSFLRGRQPFVFSAAEAWREQPAEDSSFSTRAPCLPGEDRTTSAAADLEPPRRHDAPPASTAT